MRIEQTGNYPFEDTVVLRINLKNAERKSLSMRIPSWTKGYALQVNGTEAKTTSINGYITVQVSDGDEIRLTFRKSFMSHCSGDGGIYYTYGPFVMALQIAENCIVDMVEKRQTKDFPAYNIYPQSEWRYAVSGWETPQIVTHDLVENPFWDGVPFEIRIPARKLNDWDFERCSQADNTYHGNEGQDAKQKELGASEVLDDLVLTPRISSADVSCENLGEEEMITLIPYGCTRLRLTVFPKYDKDKLINQLRSQVSVKKSNENKGI